MSRKNGRLVAFAAVLAVFAGFILARYLQLALAHDDRTYASEEIEGERGEILDRNGRVLAMDIPKYNVSIWRPNTRPEVFKAEIAELSKILGVPADEITAKYMDGTQNYFYLGKRYSADQVQPIKDGQKAGRFKGVQIDEISGRLYPEGELGSHLIGFTGEGNKGLDGIEIKYDEDLSPKPRKARVTPEYSTISTQKMPKGNTVTLTIDANLQFMLEEIARKAQVENKADNVIGLAMDVQSGEILAYVAEPGFNLNNYMDFDTKTRQDLISLSSYEPGSVFKIFSMASILDTGGITPDTMFDCDGAYRKTLPNGEKIVIKDLGVYGKQNMAGILAHSSNAGVGYASDRISEIDLYERLKSFGFGSKTGIGLSGESAGSLRPPEKWSARSKPTIAIGQEVMVTALQMITAASAVANGGILMKPVTVKQIETADGEIVYSHEPQEVRRVVSQETAKQMLTALETVSSMEGTGWRAKVKDLRMGVKTGTAQMIDPKTRAYSDTDYIASTLAVFPIEAPKIALYIVIIKPKGASYLGGQIAAPVLREATEAVLSCIDIERGKSPLITHGNAISLPKAKEAVIGTLMPDLTGYPKQALLPLLERKDISVTIAGEGYVKSQSPEPGTAIVQGMAIKLILDE
ncbi:MAG: transpeptidase family protein [Spirochaetaceae bacterium]|nr:transpeptidase family protein [Spirochaetaceae bacterium]